MTERRYAMTRLAAGDYLLPGNDRVTLFRLATYEDGPSHGLDDSYADRTYWGAWRWNIKHRWPETVDDLDNWGNWDMVAALCMTRHDAIAAALL